MQGLAAQRRGDRVANCVKHRITFIKNGIYPSGMPAWKDTLDDQQIWQVVLFIRHLPQSANLQSENAH